MNANHASHAADRFELRFHPLRDDGFCVTVPCDAAGRVDLDALSEPVRTSYYYARTVVGREFARPALVSRTLH